MKLKSHNFNLTHFRYILVGVSLLFSNAYAAPSAFQHENLGQCFDSTQSFIRTAISESALTDENVMTGSKGDWIWIIDKTATKNFTWYLLQKRANKFCLRVFVPAASDVEFMTGKEPFRLKAYISPDPGFAPKQIILESQAGTLAIDAKQCFSFEMPEANKRARPKKMDCKLVYN